MSAPAAKPSGRRRSAARLAAVQALYEMDVAGAGADPVLGEFMRERWRPSADDGAPWAAPDAALLDELVREVSARHGSLDAAIGTALSEDRSVDRLEVLLRAILRAGAYELTARPEIPAGVVINEYVDLANAFFDGREPALVNAVLDRLAATLRPDEADGSRHGGRADRG